MKHNRYDINKTSHREYQVNSSDMLYSRFFMFLYNIATSRFSWSGLPPHCPGTFPEQVLCEQGSMAIVNDKNLGFVITPFVRRGIYNLYNRPVRIRPTPFNGVSYTALGHLGQRIFGYHDFVICPNDNLWVGSMPAIISTAHMMVETWNTITQNVLQQRFPTIVECDTDEKFSAEHIKTAINGGDTIILLRRNTATGFSDGKIFNRDMPYVADKLTDHFNNILGLFMQELGINTVPNEKRERLLVDEVNSNNEQNSVMRDAFYTNRLEFCRQCNERWGLNITVTPVGVTREFKLDGGDGSGTVYNTNASTNGGTGMD